jgi:hypothetical protein
MKHLLLLFLTLCTGTCYAQELQANVRINAERLETRENQVVQQLQEAMETFLNNQQFTEDRFDAEERIQLELNVVLGGDSQVGEYTAEVQVQSLRPVYNTDYNTPLLRMLDQNWSFTYNPSDPIIFSENAYTSELSSLLTYYAYIIIGLDYDTFGPLAGTPFYERALAVLNTTQSGTASKGWAAGNNLNDRFWLVTHLIDVQFEPYRQALYQYHRLGIDQLATAPETARAEVLGALQKVQQVRKLVPLSLILNSFFSAKSTELAQLFAIGDIALRQQAIDLLVGMDATNAGLYRRSLR